MPPRIPIDREKIADFCRRWEITEFALFGTVLRDDFRPDSDVDVLVTFQDNAPWSLFDMVHMETKLCEIFGRPVDLVEQAAVRNPYRRHVILPGKEVLHAA